MEYIQFSYEIWSVVIDDEFNTWLVFGILKKPIHYHKRSWKSIQNTL